MSHRPVRQSLAALAMLSLPLLAACGASEDTDAETPTAETSEQSSAETSGTDEGETGSDDGTEDDDAGGAGSYTAGTYDASGSYQTPDGTMSVDVEVTIDEAGTIEAVTVEPQATGGNSAMFQGQFADGIADVVVGQPIDQLSVSRVAGSSLTSGGFNAAIEEIISEAQS